MPLLSLLLLYLSWGLGWARSWVPSSLGLGSRPGVSKEDNDGT